MKYKLNFLVRSALLALLILPGYAVSRVVRMDFSIGSQPPQAVYVNLLDADVPNTVSNFLNYVQNGLGDRRYDGTFIHRSVRAATTGLDVIQGGGWFLSAGLPAAVSADAPIVNEFSVTRPNVRGTLAMAKLGGNPDSATSEWFFNVIDNSAVLGGQNNGGFTVFGRVLGDGMAVVDAIAQVATENLGGIFTDVPTLNHLNPQDPITDANLVVLNQVVVDPPARISADTRDVDFGLSALNVVSAVHSVVIQNIGGVDDLAITNVALSVGDFSVSNNGCLNTVLAQTQSCTIDLLFTPTSAGSVQGTLTVSSSDSVETALQVVLRGTGAEAVPTLSIVNGNSVDFGDVVAGTVADRFITVENIGNGPLSFGVGALQLDNTADFSIPVGTDTCSGSTLNLAETCNFVVRFSAAGVTGTRTGSLTISDTQAQSIILSLTGSVSAASTANISLPLANAQGEYEAGDFEFGVSGTFDYPILNLGPGDLVFSGIRLSGPDATEFSISQSCDVLPVSVGTVAVCPVTFTVAAASTGRKEVVLEVDTNDPDTPTATVTIFVTVSQDGDGVPDSVEGDAPNGGDGNADGVPDEQQQNVTSLPDINGNYITLETDSGIRLVGVKSTDNPSPDTTPIAAGGTLSFPDGFFSFSIEGLAFGGASTVTLYLPEGVQPDSYFKYNQTLGSWFTFDFDAATGTGAVFEGNRVTLHFVDGGRGDDDFQKNGVIIDPGAPVVLTLNGGSGSSGGGGCVMLNTNAEDSYPVDLLLILAGLGCVVVIRRMRSSVL